MTTYLDQLTAGILQTDKVANGTIIQAIDPEELMRMGICFALSLYHHRVITDWEPTELENLPDFIVLDDESAIKIDRIRELQDQIKFGPFNQRRLVCVVPHVDRLSMGAANAFLKTLEEPPEGVCFVMTTTVIEQVLPTIRSRSQLVRLPGDTLNMVLDDYESLDFLEKLPIIEAFQKVPALIKDREAYRRQLMVWVLAYRELEPVPSRETVQRMTRLMDAYRDTQWMVSLKVQLEHLLIQSRVAV